MPALAARREKYARLSEKLSQLDSARLPSLFGTGDEPLGWWGVNHVIRLGRTKVFVKRVPVTEVELDNMYSTRNLYRMPTYYNYGVGSAGFGVFREIAANVKATNWVLDGSCANFAMMYHHRIVPTAGKRQRLDRKGLDEYVDYWNNSASIGRYIEDRAKTRHEAILFLEYVPHVLWSWLDRHMDRLATVIRQMQRTIAFLQTRAVEHFDCHFHNVLTDGRRVYLADFGLVLDRRFELSKRERAFFKENRYYDHGKFLSGLGRLLLARFGKLSEDRKARVRRRLGMDEGAGWRQEEAALLGNVGALREKKLLRVEGNYAAALERYAGVTEIIEDFTAGMNTSHKKSARYSQTLLRRHLKQSGFID